MSRWRWGRVAALCVVVGCQGSGGGGQGQPPPGHGDDGFAVGRAALTLQSAPAGLCDGEGSDKECPPEGCVEEPSEPSGGGTSSGIGPTPPGRSAAAGTGAGASTGGSFAPPSQAPIGGMSAGAPPVGDPSEQGGSDEDMSSEPDAHADAGALQCGDGGSAPDGGSCHDGGVAAQQAALIADDVPGCLEIEQSQPTTLFLSADDSNSMAGPVIARSMIRRGLIVPARVIRPWEFLNYYDFSFEPAEPGEVRIVPQLSSCPEDDRLSLQVALQAEARSAQERRPLTLTFVLDTSGSMSGAPIELERAAVLAIAGQLRAGDVVSMVTWDTVQAEILVGHEVTGPNDAVVVEAARALASGGGTDLHGGLVAGYGLAEQHRGTDRINRVVLISDGNANVGITDEELIGSYADDEEGEAGIYMAGIGVGDGVNDTLMNVVTDAGRGAYVYLDSEQEAERTLGERFLQVVDLSARAVRLEVTLPYHLVLEKFFGEVASTDESKVRPQHLAPNDAMLFFQVLRACDPSVLHGDDRIMMRATWETPLEREAKEAVIDTTLNELAGDDAELTKAAAVTGYAEALLEVATADDPSSQSGVLLEALEHVRSAKGADSDPDLLEIAELLERYAARLTPRPLVP